MLTVQSSGQIRYDDSRGHNRPSSLFYTQQLCSVRERVACLQLVAPVSRDLVEGVAEEVVAVVAGEGEAAGAEVEGDGLQGVAPRCPKLSLVAERDLRTGVMLAAAGGAADREPPAMSSK